jgi:hypothetical protein
MIQRMMKWMRTCKEWSYLARLGIPVFLNDKDEVCLSRKSGPNPDPVIIVSVPKSGTYLFAEVLSALGVQSADIHIAPYGFQDLRFCSRETAIAHESDTFHMVPCDKVLPLVRPGQYVVSHFPCNQEILGLLKGFKIIFTYRDLRDTLVSTMRWVAKKGHLSGNPESWAKLPDGPAKMERFLDKHGDHYFDSIHSMRDWVIQPGVLSLSFEEIQGDHGTYRQTQVVQQIADFLGISLPPGEIAQVLKKCLGKETITFSGKRSSRKDLWSDVVEGFFLEPEVRELEAFWKQHLGATEPQKCAS